MASRKGSIELSEKEAPRPGVIEALRAGVLTQREAAEQLGLSTRQVRRLAKRYAAEGAAGLVSRLRGRRPANAIPEAVREAAMELVRERYADFPPKQVWERLTELHGFELGQETVRQLMLAEGMWTAKRKRVVQVHPPRDPVPQFGTMPQGDGSFHDWMEGRAPPCCLVAFADDATRRLQAARFRPRETTEAYMRLMLEYILKWGLPESLYTDRTGIFRVNHKGKESNLTQFTRALVELDITPIHAHTPQAKGLVERAFRTLQGRLPLELRLRGIDTIEEANEFLPEYIGNDCNRRFAREPASPVDAHRVPEQDREGLERILCPHHTRTLSKNLTFVLNNGLYAVDAPGRKNRLQGRELTICTPYDRDLEVLEGKLVHPARLVRRGPAAVPVADSKDLNQVVEEARRRPARTVRKPAARHPWRVMAGNASRLAAARRGERDPDDDD